VSGDEAAELRRELDELRRRDARRADFVALVAHDLRTPLAAVIGSVQTLQQREADLTAEQRDALLGVIATEADRLAKLVAEVFDTARIDADGFSYAFAEIEVAALVEEAVAAASAAADGVEVVSQPAAGLPPVRGDHARLRQVLANLIDNAVKYSPPGGTVEVSAAASNGGVAIAVTDHGEGIAPEDRQLVFEQYGRVRGTSRAGTGLGLYIARAIAKAHGGTLELTSTPGRGSTFTLTLPQASRA
jgi:signal transduction histidine kinase